MTWILEHWEDLLAVYGAVVLICSTVIKLTPTTKDDDWWAKIVKFLDKFSTVFTKEDAEKLAKLTKKSSK